jgi:predicted nuclease of predicted toxin-antitoxin system
MKFLLNMNVPRKLGRRLTSEGHECRHVGDIGMAQVSDSPALRIRKLPILEEEK